MNISINKNILSVVHKDVKINIDIGCHYYEQFKCKKGCVLLKRLFGKYIVNGLAYYEINKNIACCNGVIQHNMTIFLMENDIFKIYDFVDFDMHSTIKNIFKEMVTKNIISDESLKWYNLHDVYEFNDLDYCHIEYFDKTSIGKILIKNEHPTYYCKIPIKHMYDIILQQK